MSPQKLEQAHKHINDSQKQFDKSKKVGCFACRKIFEPKEIKRWIEGDSDPECPYCGIDALIGDHTGFKINSDFLNQMHDYWFVI